MRVIRLLLALVVIGCGPGDPCLTPSKCSADPPRTSADLKACQQAALTPTAKCYKEKSAFDLCFRSNAVCGSDDKTDAFKTFDACMSESDAFQKCTTL